MMCAPRIKDCSWPGPAFAACVCSDNTQGKSGICACVSTHLHVSVCTNTLLDAHSRNVNKSACVPILQQAHVCWLNVCQLLCGIEHFTPVQLEVVDRMANHRPSSRHMSQICFVEAEYVYFKDFYYCGL